jgi:hypothetical protein
VLEEKRRKLKEEKDNCDLSFDVVMETTSRLHNKRNLRKRGHDNADNKSNRKKQLNDILFFSLMLLILMLIIYVIP